VRTRVAVIVVAVVVSASAIALYWRGGAVDNALTATVATGDIDLTLTVTGALRPAESMQYRSPLGTREAELVFLAAEGTRVGEGDLIARLDTADLERELARTRQELRQAQIEQQAAEIDWRSAQATVDSLSKGEGALSITEAQARVQASEKKAERLRAEVEADRPLLAKGYLTQEELNRAIDALDQAETDLAIDRQRASILSDQTRPRDEERAKLTAAQKDAQRENAKLHVQEIDAHGRELADEIEACSIHARHGGLVVYEEMAGANPRRKIRVGDHVTATQPLITIPEVSRMLVDATTSEADVHRLQPGQPAVIHLEAFPDARLTGHVARVGALAAPSGDRLFEEKRFDLVLDVDPTEIDLRPGMTARADVMLGHRSGALLVPVTAVFDDHGLTVCRVLTSRGLETRQVQLGDSNTTFAIVLGGLRDGDRVSIADPAALPSSATAAQPALKSAAQTKNNPLLPR